MSLPRTGLIAAGLLCFCAGGLYGWSALIAPLEARFEISMAQTGSVFSAAIVSFTLAVLVVPMIAARVEPLRRLAAFGFCGAACLGAASLAPTFFVFLVAFGIGFGAASGAIYISALVVAAGSARPLIATPLMVAAFGIGGVVFGPTWRVLASQGWGLSALWPLVAALVVAAAVAMWVGGSGPAPAQPKTVLEATTSPPPARILPLIWSIFALGSFAGLMVMGLAAKMMDAAQATVAASSMAMAGVTMGNTMGRISVAGMNALIRPSVCVFMALGLGACGLVFALGGETVLLLGLGLSLIALGYGILASAIPSLTRAVYGPSRFARVFAVVFSAWGVAGFSAPLVAGAMFDASGSFAPALRLALLATLAGAALTVWLVARLRGTHQTA